MTDRPAPLAWLIDRLTRLVRSATDTLEQRHSEPDAVPAWRDTLALLLTRYSAAALQAGQDGAPLSDAGRDVVKRQVQSQIGYLDQFAAEVQSASDWQRGWTSRAEMYAKSIAAPYWSGRTKMLPLPSMPGDGTTQCRVNCKCSWDIQQLEGDGNYDCYWIMSDAEHCQTCKQRAADWSPLQIRDGELQ